MTCAFRVSFPAAGLCIESGTSTPDNVLHIPCQTPPADAPTPRTAPIEEDAARAIVEGEIKRWRANGWNFAANLLQHFLDKKGPQRYAPTAADTQEVAEESQLMVESAIYRAIWDDANITSGALMGSPIDFNARVRWTATGFEESIPGSVYTAGEPLTDANDDLFYAFGGAELTLDGRVTKVGSVTTQVKSYLKFDVNARVTIGDLYSFKPTGWHDVRLWVEAYAAARFLETLPEGAYQPFRVTVMFRQTYLGLRSDQIAGGAFHAQRPYQQGEAIPAPYNEP